MKNTKMFSLCIPVRTDLDDGDSCHSVTMHDGVEDRSWTSPPWQQARVNVQNPAAMEERVRAHTHTHNFIISSICSGMWG